MKLLLVFACTVVGILAKPKPINERAKEYAAKHPNQHRNDPEYGSFSGGDIPTKSEFAARRPNISLSEGDILVKRESAPPRYWPNGILYYKIKNGDFDASEVGLIEAAISVLVDIVNEGYPNCLKILERTNERAYVSVFKDYGGCYSAVGVWGYQQPLGLHPNCVRYNGIIMHEFLHALGFWHEQSRDDRDDHITINWDNIDPAYTHNFDKKDQSENNLLGTSYDYDSVMHYSAFSFAINPEEPTIIPNDLNAEIGQRTHLSENDIERVRRQYGCASWW